MRACSSHSAATISPSPSAIRLISATTRVAAKLFPRRGGKKGQLHDWQNWRRRIYQPAATAAGVTGDIRPYRLRGSFVSLLLWEGQSLTYVAE